MSSVRITTGLPFITRATLGVRLVLLVLGRKLVPIHEQELGTEQADAIGAGLEGVARVFGQLDVGEQLDRNAVAGARHPAFELAQLDPMRTFLAHALAKFLQLVFARIDDDGIEVGVDDDQVAFGDDSRARSAPTTAGSPRLRARIAVCDVGSAELGDEPGQIDIGAVPQVQYIGRSEILRNQHQALARRQRFGDCDSSRPAAGQRVHDAFDDLPDVS